MATFQFISTILTIPHAKENVKNERQLCTGDCLVLMDEKSPPGLILRVLTERVLYIQSCMLVYEFEPPNLEDETFD